jgi:hypothetical protein
LILLYILYLFDFIVFFVVALVPLLAIPILILPDKRCF